MHCWKERRERNLMLSMVDQWLIKLNPVAVVFVYCSSDGNDPYLIKNLFAIYDLRFFFISECKSSNIATHIVATEITFKNFPGSLMKHSCETVRSFDFSQDKLRQITFEIFLLSQPIRPLILLVPNTWEMKESDFGKCVADTSRGEKKN